MSQEEDIYCELQTSTAKCPDIYDAPVTCQPDTYTAVACPPVTTAPAPRLPGKLQKFNCTSRVMIVATIANLMLTILAVGATGALFIQYTSTKTSSILDSGLQGSGMATDKENSTVNLQGNASGEGVATNSGGAIYTRWGKSSCPETDGTELLVSGITGGYHAEQGGGANYLCMPLSPEYSPNITYSEAEEEYALLWATQYFNPIVGSYGYDVPCAVCYVSTRPTVVMIPAKASCPPTWTREYYGYLMGAYKAYDRTMFECVDVEQESLASNDWGASFWHVEAKCTDNQDGSLPCPPYNNYQELNCVVCTK